MNAINSTVSEKLNTTISTYSHTQQEMNISAQGQEILNQMFQQHNSITVQTIVLYYNRIYAMHKSSHGPVTV